MIKLYIYVIMLCCLISNTANAFLVFDNKFKDEIRAQQLEALSFNIIPDQSKYNSLKREKPHHFWYIIRQEILNENLDEIKLKLENYRNNKINFSTAINTIKQSLPSDTYSVENKKKFSQELYNNVLNNCSELRLMTNHYFDCNCVAEGAEKNIDIDTVLGTSLYLAEAKKFDVIHAGFVDLKSKILENRLTKQVVNNNESILLSDEAKIFVFHTPFINLYDHKINNFYQYIIQNCMSENKVKERLILLKSYNKQYHQIIEAKK